MKILSTLSLVIFFFVIVTIAITTASAEKEFLSSSSSKAAVSLSDLPPLPQKVLQWSPTDVERWMNITVGYPELSVIIRKYLIDGPTLLNLNNIEQVFSTASSKKRDDVLHPAQIAKLRAHQRILRSQSPECGGSCSSSSSSGVNTNFWTFLSYSSLSTTFHLTTLVVAPRFGFFSALFFDRPLLCCTLATPSSTDLEQEYSEKIMDAEISSSSSSSSCSSDASEKGLLVVSPCGYPSSVCDASPSIFSSIIYFCFPFASMIWYGVLRAMCPHPFIALGWFFACLCHQIAELFTFFRIFQMLRAKEVTIGIVLKEEVVLGYLHYLFWGPSLIAIVTGYLLPHWCSYIVLLLLTGVALWSSFTFVFEFVRAMAGPPANANATDDQQQQGQQQQGQGQQQTGTGASASAASGMD